MPPPMILSMIRKARGGAVIRKAEGGSIYDAETLTRALEAARKMGNMPLATEIAKKMYQLQNPQPTTAKEDFWPDFGKSVAAGVVGTAAAIPGMAGDVIGAVDAVRPGTGKVINDAVGQGARFAGFPGFAPPTTKQILGAVPGAAGVAGYKPQSDAGNVAKSAAGFGAAAVPFALSGGTAALPWAVGRAALTGAGAGAVGNWAVSQFGEDARPWAEIAAAVPGALIVSKAAGVTARVAASLKAPSLEDMAKDTTSFYKAADNAGVLVKHDAIDNIVKDVRQVAFDNNIDEKLTPKSWDALQSLIKRTSAGTALTMQDVENLRRVVKMGYDGIEDSDAKVLSAMVSRLTDRMGTLKPTDVLSGDPAVAATMLKAARSTFQRNSKAEDIADVYRVAGIKSDPAKPGSYGIELQRGFRKIALSPTFEKFWSPEEQALIITASKGGGVPSALLRFSGRLPIVNWLAGDELRGLASLTGTRPAARAADVSVRLGPNSLFNAPTVPRTVGDLGAAITSSSKSLSVPPDMEDQYQ